MLPPDRPLERLIRTLALPLRPIAPAVARRWGVDLSHYQPTADFRALARSGCGWVHLKASEGGQYTDPSFAAHFHDARAAGLPVGAYHFARPGSSLDAHAQGRHFLTAAADALGSEWASLPGTLPPVLDIETTDGKSDSYVTGWSLELAQAVEVQAGRVPWIYTGESFAARIFTLPAFARYPWWGAAYRRRPAPRPPAPWRTGPGLVAWQHTSGARVAGLPGGVDRSVLIASQRWLAGQIRPLPAPPTPAPAPAPATPPPPPHPAPVRAPAGDPGILGTRVLAEGSQGPDVAAVQRILAKVNPWPPFGPLKVDGIFGPATHAAVADFQHRHGLLVDGIVGPHTWRALLAVYR